MTCTHAALKRREFLELAFQYDSLVMEEAAQILEIEAFIPMLLQARAPPRPPSTFPRRRRRGKHDVHCAGQEMCMQQHSARLVVHVGPRRWW